MTRLCGNVRDGIPRVPRGIGGCMVTPFTLCDTDRGKGVTETDTGAPLSSMQWWFQVVAEAWDG